MMKSRGLLVGLVVLAVLVGLLYWSNRESAAKTSKAEASVPASPKLLALNQADIVKVAIRKNGGEEVVLSKTGGGTWQITSPRDFNADSAAVSSLLSTLSSLDAERVVDEKAGDLQPYGLAPPATELTVTENGNRSQHLLIGEDTPTRSGAYAALAGDPRLFTIAGYSKTSLDKGLNDLRDKRFLTLESDKINRLEVASRNSDLEFDHYKDHWQIVKPKTMRADSAPIDALIRTLAGATIDLNQPREDKTVSSFARAEPVGTVKVMSDSGTQELNVRKIGKDYYAKSTVLDAPYKISNEVAQEISKPLDDFRNKKLFDFGYADPARIEFKDGAKSYFLTRGGADWWGAAGKKLAPEGADSFVEKLRELKADKFSESGFGDPAIEIIVTPGNGDQIEKVALAKQGTAYLAKRENDVSLYHVDADAVHGLERAAADVKETTK